MKQKVLGVMAVLFSMTAMAQQAPVSIDGYTVEVPNRSEQTLNASIRPVDEGAKAPDVIWSEDFGNGFPAGWVLEDQSGICEWRWSDDGNWGLYNGNGGTAPADVTIESTTAANGFLISDTDSANYVNNGSGASYQDITTFFAIPAIDLTGYNNVILEFQQYFRTYTPSGGVTLDVMISTDSLNWTTYDAAGGVSVNSASDNADFFRVDISAVAGGSSTCYIKIGWTCRAYHWEIDDMKIVEVPDNDIALESFDEAYTQEYDSIRTNGWVQQIPKRQSLANEFWLGNIIRNSGNLDQPGVTVDYTITSSSITNFGSSAATVLSDSAATVVANESYTATELGTYQIDMQTETTMGPDDVPNDNSMHYEFMVSDSVYSLDHKYNTPRRIFWYGPDNPTYEIGNFFEIFAQDTATSISWWNYGNSTPGQYVDFSLYEITAPIAIPLSLSAPLAQANYTLDANDADAWVDLKLDNEVVLEAGKTYWLALKTYMGSTDTLWSTHDDNAETVNSWVIINGDAANAGWPGVNTWLRLNTKSTLDECGDLAVNLNSIDDVTCAGAGDGAVNVEIVGTMHTPYSYVWSNAATTDTLSMVAGGAYSISVSNSNGCEKVLSYTVSEPGAISITSTVSDEVCGTLVGIVNSTVTGGTAPYTYAWSNGTAGWSATGLAMGTYTLDVTDANGCMESITATVGGTAEVMVTTTFVSPSACGVDDGSVNVVANDGLTTTYSYAWSNGSTLATVTGMAVGSYTVTATAGTGCMAIGSILVSDAGAQTVSMDYTNLSCNGDNSGIVTANVTGGTTPYTYDWGTGAGTVWSMTGLAAGTYNVTVGDAAGCIALDGGDITEPAVLTGTYTVTDVMCNGALTGTATQEVAGGTTPYSYDWGAGSTTVWMATGLAAGTASVTATDANGCMISHSDVIAEPTAVSVTTTSTDLTCFEDATGSISTTVSGGTTGYTYAWSPSGNVASVGNNLDAGTHTIVVTDGNGCETTVMVTLTQPATPVSVTITKHYGSSDLGVADGLMSTTAAGGAGGYSYLWSNAATTDSIYVAPGNYTVVVTDADGCTGTNSGVMTIGLDELVGGADASMSIFPNPATGAINLTLKNMNNDVYGLAVVDMLGKTVFNDRIAVNGTRVIGMDISGLKAGVYFIQVSNDHGSESLRLIVK